LASSFVGRTATVFSELLLLVPTTTFLELWPSRKRRCSDWTNVEHLAQLSEDLRIVPASIVTLLLYPLTKCKPNL